MTLCPPPAGLWPGVTRLAVGGAGSREGARMPGCAEGKQTNFALFPRPGSLKPAPRPGPSAWATAWPSLGPEVLYHSSRVGARGPKGPPRLACGPDTAGSAVGAASASVSAGRRAGARASRAGEASVASPPVHHQPFTVSPEPAGRLGGVRSGSRSL